MRESFSAEELAIVMSHFDIGVIDSIVEYPRGLAQGAEAADRQRAGQVPAQAPRPRQGRPVQGRLRPRAPALPRQQAVPAAAPDRHEARTTTRCSSGATASTSCSSTSPARPIRRRWRARSTAGACCRCTTSCCRTSRAEWQPTGGSYHMAPAVEQGLRAIPASAAGGRGDADVDAAARLPARELPPRRRDRASAWGWTPGPSRSCTPTGTRGTCCSATTTSSR